jgi:hypothetical protein
MSEPSRPFTVAEVRALAERLRRRASRGRPDQGFEGDDMEWHQRQATADACEVVADEIEQMVGKA